MWFFGFIMEKASLVFGDILSNLLVPHIPSPLEMVPRWNKFDDDFMLSMFGFVNNYLEWNGYMVLFHEDSPRITKNIKSFLKNNNFKILRCWTIANSLQCSNTKFIGKKVIYSTNLNTLVLALHHSLLIVSLFFIYCVQLGDFARLRQWGLLIPTLNWCWKGIVTWQGWPFL